MKVSIIGAGAWGTTLANVLIDNNHEVIIYDINENNINKININHLHPFFDVEISDKIKASNNLKEVVEFSNNILLAVPTKVMRIVLRQINNYLTKPTNFIDVSKGLEIETSKRVSDLVKEEIEPANLNNYAVLTGPSHAEEVILRKLTLLTVASKSEDFALEIQKLFSNDKYIRVYRSDDVIGAEVGGATKNAIAVVSGMIAGYGMGENARAALITRGILEIARVVEYYGGNKDTTFGLTGVGDLIVTASSTHSRNYRAGLRLGEGISLEQVYAEEKQTIEGIRSIEALYALANKENLYLPIITTAYKVIFEKTPLKEAVVGLLTLKLKEEEIS